VTPAPRDAAAADLEVAPSITLPVALPATARNLEILSAARSVLDAAMTAVDAQQEDPTVEAAFAAAPTRIWSWWRWRVGFVFALLDVCAFLLAWFLFPAGPAPATPVVVGLLAVLVGHRLDLNRSRLELSVLEDIPACLLVAVVVCGAALGTSAAHGDAASTFGTCFLFALVGLLFVIAFRGIVYTVFRRLRRIRKVAHPVVIVGTGEVGERLATAMLAHPEYGLRPLGFIDPEPTYRSARLPLPVLGGLDVLPATMHEHDVNDIVFAFSGAPDAQVVRIVRSYVRMDCQVFVVPRFFELYGADRRSHVEVIWGVPLVRLRRWPLRPSHTLVKRGTDIALSALALVLLSPILAVTALAVRIEGGPGIIFRQTRIGRNGAPFTLYKFRSMRPADEAERDTRWSIDGDERIGPVGGFIRRSGLDEAPQLVNVLRGDMSIVGPRPERPHFVRTFGKAVHGYRDRHRVPVGLTGLAQVNGLRGNTSIDDRVTFDNYYIDNWSLWTDVKIMLRTLRTFFRRAEAVIPEGPGEFTGPGSGPRTP
jgi:exopolysaccharide biosynthesis polyprenyl glycosylphosphotransferase